MGPGRATPRSGPIRRWCRRHQVLAVVPPRAEQRPVPQRHFDAPLYRQRNVIERAVGHLKEFGRVATRADKLAISSLSWVWLGDTRRMLRRLISDSA